MAYLRLALAAACPAAVAAALYLWSGKTAPAARRSWRRQVILGLIFGGAAVVGSEFGVPIDGAIINVRDAAPLCAGLIFGPTAGILAGVITEVFHMLMVFFTNMADERVPLALCAFARGP